MTAASPARARRGSPLTRLCILLTALAVIGRARVAVMPGWVVPLPVLLLTAVAFGCVLSVAVLVLHIWRTWPRPLPPVTAGAGEVRS